MALETPDAIDALARRVRQCATERTPVFPIGGGTGLDYGLPPKGPGVALSLAHLNRIVDYPIEDLTITVEAGMTVAHLQELLTPNNQRLPIDVPNAATATIGGAIAVNATGPRRFGYGTWRDWIIGMTVVNDRGELCKSGGRVVKNVAGYDLGKLYTGSLGTLGIIAQVTVKLQPRPEALQWLTSINIPVADVPALLDTIAGSATQPRAVELVGTTAGVNLHLLLEDNADSVAWQTEQLRRELAPLTLVARDVAVESELTNRSSLATTPIQLIATMRSSHVGAFVQSPFLKTWKFHAHAMNGIVWLGGDLPEAAAAAKFLADLRPIVSGNVVIRRCPPEWKPSLPIWGTSPPSLELMKKVKAEFDPHHLLNPGRTLI